MKPEAYIGDGVYAAFDGYQIWLMTARDGQEHSIAIEPAVMDSLLHYAAGVGLLDHTRAVRREDIR